ncbi:MAG: hypothetical protein ACFE7E_06285 [Candidatus Hodarchaeota archaeon]
MKLSEITQTAVNLLKEAKRDGLNNIRLAQLLEMPRRRVYDIIAVLRAANLISTKREKGGTRIVWNDFDREEMKKAIDRLSKQIESKNQENQKLLQKIGDLKRRIERLREGLGEEEEAISSRVKFEASSLRISVGGTARIKRVFSTGLDVTITTEKEGVIIVEPSKAEESEKEKEVQKLQLVS